MLTITTEKNNITIFLTFSDHENFSVVLNSKIIFF